ncbi:hypothetical protein HCN44_001459 [Aphidius gifuensis]|uniref:Uncharacterized protein n=1 Tax=Aphidius gifuensis TaxID=684658 RepID=A0A835CQT9_APHGI|nr:uncharacterized protein LOC122853362 [Aphidius gifuensis]KAF7992134.1 hypothetical protein HCN44_001459 [Aphidius gifuensis]
MPPASKQKGKKRKQSRNNNYVNKRTKKSHKSSVKNITSAASGSSKENIIKQNIPTVEQEDLPEIEDIEIITRQASPVNLPLDENNQLLTFVNANERLQQYPDVVENIELARLFDKIRYSEEATSALPNRSWAIHCADVPAKRIVVSEMIIEHSPERGVEPFYPKQIVIDDKLNYELFLQTTRTVLKNKSSSIRSMTDFESLLDHVSSLKLCSGGPNVIQYNNINPECAYKDSKNKWRHNLCTLELNKDDDDVDVDNNNMNNTCDACLSLEDILKRHVQRLKPSLKQRNNLLRKRPGQSRGS